MDEDLKKLKPYVNNMKRHISLLKPEINKLTKTSLDDKLIQMSNEMDKLELTNTYSYVLNSLLFAYMKLINCKDMTNIMTELNRCKEYMQAAKKINQKITQSHSKEDKDQTKLKSSIMASLNKNDNSPAISKQNFQNKHTKFEDEHSSKKEEKQLLTEKIVQNKRKKNKKSGKKRKISKK